MALTQVTGYALERHDFLDAVTASPPSARAGDAVVGARLGTRPTAEPVVGPPEVSPEPARQ
jgi:hypothetical protein